ncbi:glycoside hydrolase family 28 protein [Cerasicoccus arenae]|uniref:Polygalacturonase n=1 Tax=Cerasicoccus arenae TaxID=424488 RepID=A0A8J3DI73_9BACT|nr:glycosyl hydrolase family 28 protein [Cerasicoccus arenae]MBK1859601.1 right-handed parallel beta-helix repeat-containing protein [Cerasicoccus arenae]GHC03659.1 polygalacturonase [Cerasicoccus arenae]
MQIDISQQGCIGDGMTLNTRALQSAADQLRECGGTLYVPAGKFLTGVIRLYSNITLHLAAGASLVSSAQLADHVVGECIAGLLYAFDAENITIRGEGLIDGNAIAFFQENVAHANCGADIDTASTWQGQHGLHYGSDSTEHGPLRSLGRPGNLIVFARCKNVIMEEISITGATYWTIHAADCQTIRFDRLKIDNDPRHPNNDGIHLTTCRDAYITHCKIHTGDDAIALTGFNHPAGEREIALGLSGLNGECRDILIANCELSSRSSAIRIGFGVNPTRHVHIRDCSIKDSQRGLLVHAPQADVSNITMERCDIETQLFHGAWWGCGEPVSLVSVRFPNTPKSYGIKDVSLSKLRIRSPVGIVAYSECPNDIEKIDLNQVELTLVDDPLDLIKGGNADLRPAADRHIAVVSIGWEPTHFINIEATLLDCTFGNEKSLISPHHQ